MLRRRLILSSSNSWNRIINLFRNRVIADNGTFEADACLQRNLPILGQNLYDKASLIITPNAYKASKIYALKPTNGSGDLTFARASSRTRRNSSGAIESLANNVPALDYPVGGGCPAWLFEPQRTNLDPNSATFAGYTLDNSGGVSVSNVAASTPFQGVNTAVKVVPNAINGQHRPFGVFNLSAAGRMYCIAKADGYAFLSMGNAGSLSGGGTIFNLTNGTIATNAGYNPVIRNMGNGWYWCEIDADSGSFSRFFIIRNANNTAEYVGDGTSGILFCHKQIEVGAYATSPIITGGATVTRIADTFTLSNVYTNGLISASGGTWFVSLKNNIAYTSDYTVTQQLGLGNNVSGGTADNFWISIDGTSSRMKISKQVAGSLTGLFTTLTDNAKIAIKWNGSTADVFVNGVKVVSGTSFTPVALQSLRMILISSPFFIDAMSLYPSPLTDSELIALTTL